STMRPWPACKANKPERPSRYLRPLVSQMYAPSPRSMIGTGLVAKPDIRVKCIHRCSAALLCATGGVELSSVIMLSVIGTPIVVRTSNSVTVTDGHDPQVRHQ